MALSDSVGVGTSIAAIGGPIAGIAGGLGMAAYDYYKNKEAKAKMEDAQEKAEYRRDIASYKMNKELDEDYARRQNLYRGQISNSPLYNAMLGRASKTGAINQQSAVDNLTKMGMGDKSGMAAQMASQNYNNLMNNVTSAVTKSMPTQRAYTPLANLALSNAPEQMQVGISQPMYNDTKYWGANLQPVMSGLYGLSAKYAHDAGLGGLESYLNGAQGGLNG